VKKSDLIEGAYEQALKNSEQGRGIGVGADGKLCQHNVVYFNVASIGGTHQPCQTISWEDQKNSRKLRVPPKKKKKKKKKRKKKKKTQQKKKKKKKKPKKKSTTKNTAAPRQGCEYKTEKIEYQLLH